MKKRIINVVIIAIIATIISVLMNQNEVTKTLLNLVIDVWWVVLCCKIVWSYIKDGSTYGEHKNE